MATKMSNFVAPGSGANRKFYKLFRVLTVNRRPSWSLEAASRHRAEAATAGSLAGKTGPGKRPSRRDIRGAISGLRVVRIAS